MTVFSGQTENAGHFLQLATMAIGHKVIALLLRWLFAHRANHDGLLGAIVSVSRRACNAGPPEGRFWRRPLSDVSASLVSPCSVSCRTAFNFIELKVNAVIGPIRQANCPTDHHSQKISGFSGGRSQVSYGYGYIGARRNPSLTDLTRRTKRSAGEHESTNPSLTGQNWLRPLGLRAREHGFSL